MRFAEKEKKNNRKEKNGWIRKIPAYNNKWQTLSDICHGQIGKTYNLSPRFVFELYNRFQRKLFFFLPFDFISNIKLCKNDIADHRIKSYIKM